MSFRDFPFLLEMIGGSLKIWRSNGWFCIRFHFFIKTSFKVDTEGWYCVTKGNISFFSFLLCFRSADSLSMNFTSDRRFSIIVCGQPLSIKRSLKFELLALKTFL